jgi:hypothetical protein
VEAVKLIGIVFTVALRGLEIAGTLRGSFVTLTRRWQAPRASSPAKYRSYTLKPDREL